LGCSFPFLLPFLILFFERGAAWTLRSILKSWPQVLSLDVLMEEGPFLFCFSYCCVAFSSFFLVSSAFLLDESPPLRSYRAALPSIGRVLPLAILCSSLKGTSTSFLKRRFAFFLISPTSTFPLRSPCHLRRCRPARWVFFLEVRKHLVVLLLLPISLFFSVSLAPFFKPVL